MDGTQPHNNLLFLNKYKDQSIYYIKIETIEPTLYMVYRTP